MPSVGEKSIIIISQWMFSILSPAQPQQMPNTFATRKWRRYSRCYHEYIFKDSSQLMKPQEFVFQISRKAVKIL